MDTHVLEACNPFHELRGDNFMLHLEAQDNLTVRLRHPEQQERKNAGCATVHRSREASKAAALTELVSLRSSFPSPRP